MPKSRNTVLAVDDVPANREIYELVLAEPYDLRVVESGEQALEAASSLVPDIVLLDINMPGGIDGYETCRRLRRDPKLRYAKILLVSAEQDLTDRLEGYEAGADDFIMKPFDEDELLAKIEVFLRLKFTEEVSRFKGDVLNLLGHEMRTPMNAIIGPAEILAGDGEMGTETRTEWARMILDGASRLNRLLDRVMLLSQLKAGTLETSETAVDLADATRRGVEKLAEMAEARGVDVSVEGALPVTVVADPDQVDLVVESLLDNAIRFSEPRGKVELELAADGDEAVLAVVDHGAGIDAELMPHLFEEFSTNDIRHHQDGHGLSLALVRAIVDHTGGDIEASSVPGETRLTVRLPVAR